MTQYCHNREIKIIEDCALSLFTKIDESFIGNTGDAAIFSLMKFLPVPDGGVLRLNNKCYAYSSSLNRPPFVETFKSMLPLIKRWVLSISQIFFNATLRDEQMDIEVGSDKEKHPDIPESYYYDSARYNYAISKLTLNLLHIFDHRKIIKTRRNNYRSIQNTVSGLSSIRPLFTELPKGVCPVMFPIIANDRNAVLLKLNYLGIPAFPWWGGYHNSLDYTQFKEACFLKDHVFCIPIHQDLSNAHINYMKECLNLLD